MHNTKKGLIMIIKKKVNQLEIFQGFGSYESRFIMKFQINELNGVGKYNLIYPLKKVNEGNRHF